MCADKKKYRNKARADRVVDKMAYRSGIRGVCSYQCPKCGKWHVGNYWKYLCHLEYQARGQSSGRK